MSAENSRQLQVDVIFESKRKGMPSAALMRKYLQRAWQIYGGPQNANLCLVLMEQDAHTDLHTQFLNDPTPTDVMAFPYDDDDLFGEIVVNSDMAEQQCARFSKNFSQEILLYVVHGALHLIGFDDLCEASKCNMRLAEKRVLGG
jgi:rRNA maturation RNase YbeY